ncbi:MAG: hypothetical protein JSU72_09040 [Deltaproteobacteria bacterium]|nr:MAG: hypothetical protein JSU72_09040 [Deltaproteobacteria bacterium]
MDESRPSCFGIPEKCMPRDENGIIQPQELCRDCNHLRACLQEAISASGGIDRLKHKNALEGEKPDQPGGIVGAILRWSERKREAQKG